MLAVMGTLLLAACAGMQPGGPTIGSEEPSDIAIACRTDEALAAADRMGSQGGLAEQLAAYEKIVILTDAGRTQEAGALVPAYLATTPNHSQADLDRRVQENVANMREQRAAETGSPSCPARAA